MVDTIPDITINNREYTNINLASEITAGTALIISNKSLSPALLQVSLFQPADDSTDGEILNIQPHTTAVKIITSGGNSVWARATKLTTARLSVQDNT